MCVCVCLLGTVGKQVLGLNLQMCVQIFLGLDMVSQLAQQPGLDIVHNARDLDLLATLPGGAHDGRLGDGQDRVAGVDLDQGAALLLGVLDRIEPFAVLLLDLLDVAEPVVDQAVGVVAQSGGNTAAAVVATDDDMFDLEDIDGVLKDREAVQVGAHDDVGDVAVGEDLSWG